MKRLAPLLLLFVVACASSVEGHLAQACSSWGSLTYIAGDMVNAGKLTNRQIANFIELRSVVRLTCATDNPTDADIATLRRAIRSANTMGIRER